MISKIKTTIADQVFDTLCSKIVKGDISAGSKISEPELASALSVSRASLREAITRLEACNLVTRKANIGARIVSLSREKLLEIYRIREALEGLAARLAAQHISTHELTQLEQLLLQHETEVKQADGSSYFQRAGDLDFHYHIAQSSHNDYLIGLLCHDLYHLMRMYRYQYSRIRQRTRAALDEHHAIVAAIKVGDGELAELTMRHHIRRSQDNIEPMITPQVQE